MNVRHVRNWYMVATLAALGTSFGPHSATAAPPSPAAAEQGMHVLTRGPVHEAFAETVTYDPEPGLVVSQAPPAAIEELPPDQRPQGANVAWVPGYWGWDDERKDFLWVSGIWRDLPPGRQWVPGYWGKSAQGFQWTSGYWADARATEVQYLSEPPATVEAGPNVAAPSADATWLPGCWVWQTGRYAWRPGFWAAVQPNWDWVPAHYVWAPRGYVFVDGYWDHSIGRRGVLFAPVYFDAGVYARPGFSYSPATVIDIGALVDNLFMRPQYQHYYFGDYYAANYQAAGLYPSYSYNSGRFGYDPIYAHERWQHRQDGQWEQHVAATFQDRRDHEEARPPRIWTNQGPIGGGGVASAVRNIVGASLDQASRSRSSAWQFQRVDQAERQRLAQQGEDVQRFREERQRLEARAAGTPAEARAKELAPATERLRGSPIAAKPVATIGTDRAPPRTYDAPQPDLRVQAKPRVARSPAQPPQGTVNRAPLGQTPTHPVPPPKVERATLQPLRQPQAERAAPQPEPQPKAVHPAPQPQPRPQAERPAPAPRGNVPAGPPAAGSKQDKPTGKDKN